MTKRLKLRPEETVMLRLFGVSTLAVMAALSTSALGQDAPAAKVSRPGEYKGYSSPLYDGSALSSVYVTLRDGVRLAIDIFRPTRNGVVVNERLPVVWMHSPYNRRPKG